MERVGLGWGQNTGLFFCWASVALRLNRRRGHVDFYNTTPFVFLEHDCFQAAFGATNSRLCPKYRQNYSRKI